MKNILIILIAACTIAACESNDKKNKGLQANNDSLSTTGVNAAANPAEATTIQWLDSTTVDMGKIKEGQLLEVSFRFKNSGEKNLVIENVSASCGCTIPEKPEEPIAPGKEGVIKAKFDSRGKPGEQNKTITVTANTTPEKMHYLNFKVQVTTE